MKKTEVGKRMLGILLGALLLTACGESAQPAEESAQPTAAAEAEREPAAEEKTVEEKTAEEKPAEEKMAEEKPAEETAAETDEVCIRVGSLKGPTTIGLVQMMKENEGSTLYEFTMETQADALMPMLLGGDLDIALLPANVAAVLYQKSNASVQVLDINTLGVLYMVSADDTIQEPADLAGHTVLTTGKGTTPEYVLRYVLEENGIDDQVEVEFASEATEVAARLAKEPELVGMLPQPFVTAAMKQNEELAVCMDMTQEWESLGDGKTLVTGVTLVRKDFALEHPQAVERFLADHKESAAYTESNTEEAAGLVAEYGIIEKAPVAQLAIPYCHICAIDGEEMKTALSGYLEVLYGMDPASVGGALPGEDFYYIAE